MNGAQSPFESLPEKRSGPQPVEPVGRETLRTPTGELVSLPRVRRRSWVVTILLVVAILVALLIILLAHQPGATSPGGAQPTPVTPIR